MSLDSLVAIFVSIAVFEMMAAVGLGVAIRDVVAVARDGRLLARAVVANYVCVPAATVILLLLFNAHPMVAAGFLVLAVCPGAPYGPPLTVLAGGNAALSVGLMTVLAVTSAVIAPASLYLLLPWIAGDGQLQIDVFKMMNTLILVQLLPLGAGLAVRHFRPGMADRAFGPALKLGKVLNVAAIVLILAADYHLLMEVRLKGLIGMLLLLTVSLAAGWFLSGRGVESRKTLALTTSLRNVGVGLVIATGAFGGTPAVTAVLAYGLVGILGSLLIAWYWGRRPVLSAAVTHETKAGRVRADGSEP
jgi:bile acid:Na+ symporter, BASS family